jgi:hypothetical protein
VTVKLIKIIRKKRQYVHGCYIPNLGNEFLKQRTHFSFMSINNSEVIVLRMKHLISTVTAMLQR